MIRRTFFILVVIALFAGCRSQPTPNRVQNDVGSQETPVQKSITSSPLSSLPLSSPVETPSVHSIPTLPAVSSGKAAVRGRLLATATQHPIGETLIYLTPGVGEKGDMVPPLLAGPQESDIRGYTDKDGWFTFADLQPGTYYLVIWAPLSWVLLTDANAGPEPIQLNLQPGQVLDLGEILARWPG